MRTSGGGTSAARVEGDELVLLDAADVGELLARSGADRAQAKGAVPFAGADLAPLVLQPAKVLCVGLNYRAHILEMGRELPTHPTLFTKFARSLAGAHDDLALPPESGSVDWEAELAVVVGREVRRASVDEAAAAIAGFTVANDVSMRDWQYRTQQWIAGKAWERSTPVGPVLVTPDEVDDARDLEVRCEVDGEVVQRARTSDLLFAPAAVVSYVSTFVTLEPGDLILTGTPGGVGAGRQPPVYLQDGQLLVTAVEGIGELRNAIVAEPT